ncbi:hypothetical protein BE21_35795, partial [Sorangium cellulosum]
RRPRNGRRPAEQEARGAATAAAPAGLRRRSSLSSGSSIGAPETMESRGGVLKRNVPPPSRAPRGRCAAPSSPRWTRAPSLP